MHIVLKDKLTGLYYAGRYWSAPIEVFECRFVSRQDKAERFNPDVPEKIAEAMMEMPNFAPVEVSQ